jgi:hypothetical protein
MRRWLGGGGPARYSQGMDGGAVGTMTNGTGTNGGWRGMNRAQRRIALGFLAGFLAIDTLILIANAESTLADLASSGAHGVSSPSMISAISTVIC